MQNKNEGNENKIMLKVLNCTIGKIDRAGENKIQRLYRCCSNYTLSKLIVDNGLEDLWRRENSDYPLLNIIMLFLLTDSPQKLKLEIL